MIVAIFIVGIMLIMVQAVARSGTLVRTAKNQGIALGIARDELDTLRALGYASLPANGPFASTLLSTLPVAATTSLSVSTYDAKTKQVAVTVTWRDPGAAASSTVSLTTLITQTGALP